MMLNRMQNRARLTRLATPQVERNRGTWLLTRSTAAPNWPADEWEQLDRFLIFGSERDAHVLRGRIEADGPRVVRRVVELIAMGRVVSDEPCRTALAMCATLGNEATRTMALEAAAEVAGPGNQQGGEAGRSHRSTRPPRTRGWWLGGRAGRWATLDEKRTVRQGSRTT